MIAYLKKLKHTLLFKCLKDNYIIIVLLLIFLFLIIKSFNIIIIGFFVSYLIYLFIKNWRLAVVALVILMVVLGNAGIRSLIQSKVSDDYEGYAKVLKIKKQEDHFQVTFKIGLVKVIYYSEEKLNCGDIYLIKGKITKADTSHYLGGFNYRNYLKYKNIVGIITIEKQRYYKKGFSIYSINETINQYLDNKLQTSAKPLVKALTIGNKDEFEDELATNISKIGISHLFVISGLHVNIIVMIIGLILTKLKMREKPKNIIIIIFLLSYYLISGLLISVFRVVFNYFLKFINQLYHYQLTNIDLMMINIISVLVINPFNAYQYSFILSYAISSTIIIASKILTSKNQLIASFKVSLLSIIATLPIVININPQINFLSLIYNLLYIPLVTYVLLPMSILLVFFPFLEKFTFFIFDWFKILTTSLSKIEILSFTFPNVNLVVIFLYYFVIYIILSKLELKKNCFKEVFSLILILFIWHNANFFNIYDEVYFLDLPKGDATLIRKSFNQANILIDTGENGYDDIILFLQKLGIKRLDMIIISHGDSDHNGMLDEIIDLFKVKNVCYGLYDRITPQKIPAKINQRYLKMNDEISFANMKFKVLSPKQDYHNENDNSLVIWANLFGKKYLFTGDISKKIENILKLNVNDVDVLKIAHHGSNTSSDEAFLAMIGFLQNNQNKLAICMNGYRNQFAFPSAKVIEKIKTPLLITSKSKTIRIRKGLFNQKYKIKHNW